MCSTHVHNAFAATHALFNIYILKVYNVYDVAAAVFLKLCAAEPHDLGKPYSVVSLERFVNFQLRITQRDTCSYYRGGMINETHSYPSIGAKFNYVQERGLKD